MGRYALDRPRSATRLKVFQLRMDAARWQRRFTLRQRALNRGETPDLMSIEKELDAEFAD